MDFPSLATRLSGDPPTALKAASEIRERIEIVHTTEFSNFLSHTFEPFRLILMETTRPSVDEGGVVGKLRRTVLEILNRLPNNEILRPHSIPLLHTAMHVLSTDYEECALITLRIIFDLHKNYRPGLEEEVQPFLNFVVTVYKNLGQSIKDCFNSIHQDDGTDLPPSMQSHHFSSPPLPQPLPPHTRPAPSLLI